MEEYNLTNTSGYDLAVTNASGTIELGDREFYIVSSGGPGHILVTIYISLAAVFSLIGNTVVIYATIKYSAFGMGNVSNIFIRHLAISDTIFSVLSLFPRAITLIARRWLFGSYLCSVLGILPNIPFQANIWFILTISLHRLLLCMFPFIFSSITKRSARIVSGLIWIWSSFLTVYVLWTRRSVGVFDSTFGSCYPSETRIPGPYLLAFTLVFFVIPFAVIILNNIGLWFIAQKHATRLGVSGKKAIFTTWAVSWLLIISWILLISLNVLSLAGIICLKRWVIGLSINLFFINTFGNPVVYTCVNREFRQFIIKRLKSMFRFKKAAYNKVSKSKHSISEQITAPTGVMMIQTTAVDDRLIV